MEDICINDWSATECPTDTRLSVSLVRMASTIMATEKKDFPRQSRPGSGIEIERQDCFHRAVLKLYLLLCSPEGEELGPTASAMEAVARFEDWIASAGYPDGMVVSNYDRRGNILPVDEKCIPPRVEYVVNHLRDRRIFPTRFWSDDWPFERIEAELETRFKKISKLRADCLSRPMSLGQMR